MRLNQRGETMTIILCVLAGLGSAAGAYMSYTGKSPAEALPAGSHTELPDQAVTIQTGSGFGKAQMFEMKPGKNYTVELRSDGTISVKEGIVCEIPEAKK